MTKDSVKFVYVGKEKSKHILPQEEINEVIYQEALKNEVVVRLKGGDPFVFGRGGEEGLFLKSKNIDFEVIPGITSAISVPAYAGIPVTHRGICVSFRVVTGHEAKKDSSEIPWETFKTDDTIVFLMGLYNLKNITTKLISIGKAPNTPIAVISKGTTPEQKVVIGDLEDIVQKSKKLPTPALIVIGEVVKFSEKLNWFV
jgi:uroporphyrin-III C-methyltransferase